MILRRAGAYLLFLSSVSLLAQNPARVPTSTQHFPAYPVGSHQSVMPMDHMPLMTMVAPLFIESGQISSSIVLVNNSELYAGSSVVVLASSGAVAARTHIVLAPHQQQVIPISTLLLQTTSRLGMGSVTVTQDPQLKGMTIAAQLMMTDRTGSTPNYVDEELAMPSAAGSVTLRAVTDDTQGDVLVAVTNTSDMPQKILAHCLGTQGKLAPFSATLQASGSFLFSGCAGAPIESLSTYLTTKGQTSTHHVNGIEISGEGEPGSLSAFALAPHIRNNGVIFSAIPFSDPALINSPSFVFAGVPIGPQPTLPDGIYVPRISLANFSSSPAHITIYSADSSDMDAAEAEAGPSSALQQVRSITLQPSQSIDVVMDVSHLGNGLLHSVRVTSDMKPGEVIGKLVSRSDGTLFQVELLGKDEHDQNNGGMHPWSTEGDTQSHLLLFNHSEREQTFDVAIHNDLGIWDKQYKVAPYQTREINFNQIIAEKLPDDKGRILDPSVNHGTVNWMVPDSGDATGRLMVTSHSAMMSRNYSCGTFIIVCGLILNVFNNDYIPVNYYTGGWGGTAEFCDEFGPNQCGGGSSTGSGSASFSNSISPTSIVRFNNAADATSSQPNLFGVSRGIGGGYMNAEAGGCSAAGTPNPAPTVKMPNHIVIVSDVTTSQGSINGPVLTRQIHYQVIATDGTNYAAPMSVLETVDPSTQTTCTKSTVRTNSTCTPIAGGNYIDTFNAGVPATKFLAQGCGYTFPSQYWEWCNPGTTTPVSLGDIGTDIVHNNSISIGGNTTSYPAGQTFPHP